MSVTKVATDALLKELEVVKQKYSELEGVELECCVPMSVRFKIIKTKLKTLTLCIQFHDDYPASTLIIEPRSYVMSHKFIDGLKMLCIEEAKKFIGQQQILPVLHFAKNFIDTNPLCVCSEEIAHIKRCLMQNGDEIKLKQKTSQVTLKIVRDQYYFTVHCTVPNDYYTDPLIVDLGEHNFPESFRYYFIGNSQEICRRCTQPPVKKNPKAPAWEAKPALKPVAEFLFENIKRFPTENCPICHAIALPKNPAETINVPNDPKFVDRVYCGHLYHHECMDKYMKTPPFIGGKKCPVCDKRIYHDKWKVSPELQEARWAHKEARKRELEEVMDFLD